MKLIKVGTRQVITEAPSFIVGERVKTAEAVKVTAERTVSEVFDRPVIQEWEVISVNMTRNVAYAELKS